LLGGGGGYKPAGGMGDKLQIYIDCVKKETNIAVKNIFEIGANFAQDADYLMEQFGLKPNDVYVFEAHPEIYEAIKKIHKFNAYNNAVYNEEKEIEFNIHPLDHKDTGWSSIFGNDGKKIKIGAIRMDNFMIKNNIESIDFLKIDVERATFHVLEGFGQKLADVKCIQLEAEHNKWAVIPYEKIEEILLKQGFELIYFTRNNLMRQSDSFWVKKEYVKYPKE
jgi:FkbM family methyltransferase